MIPPSKISPIKIVTIILSISAGMWATQKYFRSDQLSTALNRPRTNLAEPEFRTTVASMRLRHPQANHDKALVSFGNKLFFDKELSANKEVSCASCHKPEASFTDGKKVALGLSETAMNTPTIINAYAGYWFFWNGRADSLLSQALGPIENGKEHGFSRSKVASVILQRYRGIYEQLFGAIPSELLSLNGLDLQPPPRTLTIGDAKAKNLYISSTVAAYALATLDDKDLLKEILSTAQSLGVQPVEILKQRSSGLAQAPVAASDNQAPTSKPSRSLGFEDLSPQEQKAINQMYANVGWAIEAFEQTIRTEESPFDQFVDRYLASSNTAQAFNQSFGESELNGLRLFTGKGNCTACHQGPYFTDQQFHNIGLGRVPGGPLDLGRSQGILQVKSNEFNCRGQFLNSRRPSQFIESCLELPFLETESAEAVGAFKTPTLRNLPHTAPYGHDGRFPRIQDVLHHYQKLGIRPAIGHTEETLIPLEFSDRELEDLESFLKSLSSSVTYFKEDHP